MNNVCGIPRRRSGRRRLPSVSYNAGIGHAEAVGEADRVGPEVLVGHREHVERVRVAPCGRFEQRHLLLARMAPRREERQHHGRAAVGRQLLPGRTRSSGEQLEVGRDVADRAAIGRLDRGGRGAAGRDRRVGDVVVAQSAATASLPPESRVTTTTVPAGRAAARSTRRRARSSARRDGRRSASVALSERRASTATATNTSIRYTFENAKNRIARFGVGSRCSASACTTNSAPSTSTRDRVEAADVAGERQRERERHRDHRVGRDLARRDLRSPRTTGQHRDAGGRVVVAVLHRERPEVRRRPEEHDGEQDPRGRREVVAYRGPADERGTAPAAPPITMFCTVRGFSQIVYTNT